MNAVAGSFTYPPQNSKLQFDYSDTVVTSWVTNDSDPTEGVLTLWYWLLNGQSNWTITSLIEAVPANGSKSVALDVGPVSDFAGQLNINYNSGDGSQQKYTSPLFGVFHHVGVVNPVTWNQQALSTTWLASHSGSTETPNIPSSTSTGTSTTSNPSPHLAFASIGISATTSATTSASASTGAPKTYQSPSSATVIGLSIGIIFGIAAICLIGFLYWVKKKKVPDRRKSHEMSQEPAPLVSDARTMEEMDASQKRLELPVGRLDAELDGGHPVL